MLRMMFQDELFVRSGQTMEPTPYALQLAVPVRRFLAQAQEALTFRTGFDSLSERRIFRIAFSGSLAALMLPKLFTSIHTLAPGIRISARETNQRMIAEMLRDGLAEIGVGYFDLKQSWIQQETLFQEKYVCCFNDKLLEIGPRIDFDRYFDLPHVMVSTRDSHLGCLERAFDGLGRSPNVVASVSHFFPAAAMAAQSPVLTTLPATVARRYAPLLDLTISPLPFDIETYPATIVWHSRLERDGGTRWLRERVKEVVGSLRADFEPLDLLPHRSSNSARVASKKNAQA
jgi:DNA-binding transcriptional LysR family regulator